VKKEVAATRFITKFFADAALIFYSLRTNWRVGSLLLSNFAMGPTRC
jgi:hypothetical protein